MRKRITVKGLVQGVGFRYFTNKLASKLGVTGFVRNLINGDVEIEAQSSEKIFTEFIRELWIGPPNSHVRDIDIEDTPDKSNEFGFKVSS